MIRPRDEGRELKVQVVNGEEARHTGFQTAVVHNCSFWKLITVVKGGLCNTKDVSVMRW